MYMNILFMYLYGINLLYYVSIFLCKLKIKIFNI